MKYQQDLKKKIGSKSINEFAVSNHTDHRTVNSISMIDSKPVDPCLMLESIKDFHKRDHDNSGFQFGPAKSKINETGEK